MNKHISAQGPVLDSLGKEMKAKPNVRAEGAYSLVRMVRVAVTELDGSELYGKARLVMGTDGKPEKLVVTGGLLPLGNVLIAQSGSAAYLITLEKDGKDLAVKTHTNRNGMNLVCEFKITSAMRITGNQMVKDDPESWGDVIAEAELDELKAQLDGVLTGKASSLTTEQVLRATFKFTDGRELEGKSLFGNRAEAVEGTITVDCGERKKMVDALKVCGELGRPNGFLIKGVLANVADLGPVFLNVNSNPNAFTAEIDGLRYSGVVVYPKSHPSGAIA